MNATAEQIIHNPRISKCFNKVNKIAENAEIIAALLWYYHLITCRIFQCRKCFTSINYGFMNLVSILENLEKQLFTPPMKVKQPRN